MKTLVNCTPSEFLSQTYKIKTSVAKWLTDTDIINIRKKLPKGLIKLNEIKDGEDRAKVIEKNKELLEKQSRENLSIILDAIMKDHPQETLEILALICFIDPSEVDSHPMREYLMVINEIINDEAVIGFFTSLTRLGLMNTQNALTT